MSSATLYCKRILKKEFVSSDSKTAYLSVCKWLTKIVSNDVLSRNVNYKIERKYEETTGLTKFILNVYVVIDESEIKEKHCEICKETHSLFYMSEETNCNWCKIQAFDERLSTVLQRKASFLKEKMHGNL